MEQCEICKGRGYTTHIVDGVVEYQLCLLCEMGDERGSEAVQG